MERFFFRISEWAPERGQEGSFSRASGRIIWCTSWVLPWEGWMPCWPRCYDSHAHPVAASGPSTRWQLRAYEGV